MKKTQEAAAKATVTIAASRIAVASCWAERACSMRSSPAAKKRYPLRKAASPREGNGSTCRMLSFTK